MGVSEIEKGGKVRHPADEAPLTRSVEPPFINPESTSTPISVLSDSHYAVVLGLPGTWDRKRVLRLCEFMGITRFELASLLFAPHSRFEEWFKRETFPGPVLVLLTIVEAEAMEGFLFDSPVDPGEPVVPFSRVAEQANARKEPESEDPDDPPKDP